jgi:hypothetical protein
MRTFRFCGRILTALVMLAMTATCVMAAQNVARDVAHARHKLYTQPDSSSSGGIKGKIKSPMTPIEQILAIPADEPRFVYEGKRNGTAFSFSGLPMGKYDLVVIYDNSFYEGLRLHRERDTLTAEDRKKIEASITKSEPFFNTKIIHRLEGTTGRGNLCRAICTYVREKSAVDYAGELEGFRRTFKIVILKDVGPGWQIVRSRDLFPLSVEKVNARPRHFHSDSISGIRVSDYEKDLGMISLP